MAYYSSTVRGAAAYMSVKVKKGGRMKPPNLDNGQLTAIGNEMVRAQLARWAKGVNADGQPAKPLSRRYMFIKKKVTGQARPKRDNNITGALVKNFQLRRANEGRIRAEPTQRLTRQQSMRAEQYDQMTGFAPTDEATVLAAATFQYGGYTRTSWQPSDSTLG